MLAFVQVSRLPTQRRAVAFITTVRRSHGGRRPRGSRLGHG